MQNFKTFLNEASLSRVHAHTKDRNIGIISAHRGENSPDENKAASASLHNDIRKAGFGLVNIHGRYVENKGTPQERKVSEHSYLVIGKKGDDSGHLLGFLKKHGSKYNQDPILHKKHDDESAKLHGTRERVGDFHSAMRGGKKTFTFESIAFTNSKSFFSRVETEF
jgi:hypothetical protein